MAKKKGGEKGAKGADPTATITAEIETSLNENRIGWKQILLLGKWGTLTAAEDSTKREVGKRLYLRASEAFLDQNEGAEIAVFRSIQSGVSLLSDGQLRVSVNSSQIHFNSSDASRLIFKIDALAEEAKEWLLNDSPAPPPTEEQNPGVFRRAWKFVTRSSNSDTALALRPHSLRAYSLASGVIEAIAQENTMEAPAPGTERPKPGSEFTSKIASLQLELKSARSRFKQAAQRIAQGRYWQGTMFGALLLGLLSVFVGLVFWWQGVDAAYGIALPAGGLGAMISVLQRMSSGKLVLDTDAGRDLVEAIGAVRPFIGAIFGMALMALLLGGLVPAIVVPAGKELAFFAGIGFLAGFNERWAQDMLKGSSDQLGDAGANSKTKTNP